MITEELIPEIDEKYRTIRDARYRLTAGCSMGGQGAYAVALHNPEYFSGAVSFFGAFSYGEENSPNVIAAQEAAEYLDYFSMYFICGNQDSYGFGVPAIELHQILLEKDVKHCFFIENGGHDSAFYVPYFQDAFGYIRSEMYQSEDAIEDFVQIEFLLDGTKAEITITPKKGLEKYFNWIPASSCTKEMIQPLNIPFSIKVIQEGIVVYEVTENENVVTEALKPVKIELDAAGKLDPSKEFVLECNVKIFDRVITRSIGN